LCTDGGKWGLERLLIWAKFYNFTDPAKLDATAVNQLISGVNVCTAIYAKKLIINRNWFSRKWPIFSAENWSKPPKNCDRNIDPRIMNCTGLPAVISHIRILTCPLPRALEKVPMQSIYRKVLPCPVFTFWIFAQNKMTSSGLNL
jgi:hypothetical protein